MADDAPDLTEDAQPTGADGALLTDLARAKVNLFLHVRGRRPDGRHSLESLAVFPQIGDVLSVERSPMRSLSLEGPFALDLGSGEDNLVTQAVEALAEAMDEPAGLAIRLDKRLPIASGVGGGSADAAAALRLGMRLWGRAPGDAALAALALRLGADVPVCLGSAPALMSGVGETLDPAPPFPGFWMVLANPMRQLPTAQVFAGLTRRENPAGPAAPARFARLGDFVAWLARQRNDLEAPARAAMPAVAAVLGALRWSEDCLLARMSGSGATCFGMFADQAAALTAADAIRAAHPEWWTAAAPVAPWAGAPNDQPYALGGAAD